MPDLRCVIFAAVSSKPQAASDKDSIPTQISRARDVIERRGWTETHDPLIVPGHTRSISWLHEARDDVPAISDLIALAQRGAIDLVVCRDYDRLARKRSLLAQISEYLRQRRVQIYALDKPVAPADPDALGRRGEGRHSTALIEAISGVASEQEVNRLTDRREFGMNAIMRQGKYKLPETMIPYGYSRVATNDLGETVRLDVPRIQADEAAIVARIEDLYLDGYSYRRIAELLNSEGVPSPRSAKWVMMVIRGILRNAFYCGLIVWGYTRTERVYDPDEGDFVKKRVHPPIVETLRTQIGYLPNAFDLLEYPEACERNGVIVAEGKHEKLRTKERQREIFAEIARRRRMGGRASSTVNRCYLFSGLLRCARCGNALVAHTQSRDGYAYYYCSAKRDGLACDNRQYIRESTLYSDVMRVLHEIAGSPNVIDQFLAQQRDERRDAMHDEHERLESALEGLKHKRARWDHAYESEVIDLASYQHHLQTLEAQRAEVTYRLKTVTKKLDQHDDATRRREDLLALVDQIPEPDDRQATKVFLRRVVSRIEIDSGEIARLVL